MLRTEVRDALNAAQKAKEDVAVGTLRLILAAIKDRDIAARSHGNLDGIEDGEILVLLQSMIKQRRESIAAYVKGGRQDLADQEAAEIEVIERFLPEQLDDSETKAVIDEVIRETGATNLKDMGPTMAALRQRYPGRMDFAKASALVKERLAS
jgi:uncharacterized protein YqeY